MEELKAEILLLRENYESLNKNYQLLLNDMATIREDMNSQFTIILRRIVEVASNADINERIYSIGRTILDKNNKISGISPGGIINSATKSQIAELGEPELIKESTESDNLAQSPDLAKPDELAKSDEPDNSAKSDPMRDYFIKHWLNNTQFKFSPTRNITYKALLVTQIKDEIAGMAKSEGYIITSFETDPKAPEFIYRFCKTADTNGTSESGKKYYSFIGKTFSGEFKEAP